MEIFNERGFLRNVIFLEELGGAASEYCLSEDKKKFIKVFYPHKYPNFEKELEGINTIIAVSGGKDKVPDFMLLPEFAVIDENKYCFVFETHPGLQDIQTYLCDECNFMDEKLFKQTLKCFINCFNWLSSHRLAHRDYKMENCLIWKDAFGKTIIKIIDFTFVSSYDDVLICGTPAFWPIELQLLHCNPSTYEQINLGSEKYKDVDVRNYFIKWWGRSSLRTFMPDQWKRVDNLIKESDFTFNRRYIVKELIKTIYTTIFPIKSGKYHDMYTLVMLFKRFLRLREQITMSDDLVDALQKVIGNKTYLLWTDLKYQFEEGLDDLIKIVET